MCFRVRWPKINCDKYIIKFVLKWNKLKFVGKIWQYIYDWDSWSFSQIGLRVYYTEIGVKKSSCQNFPTQWDTHGKKVGWNV